ncbi:tetratricopeptide repeat protein, partial [Stenotrophomonas sp. MY15]|nr:tetratricopeptide repeat protein [Stenotrophomonas sp. MY15]
AIAAGLIIGIGGIAGWNYYQSHQVSKLQDAAIAYETAIAAKGNPAEQTA